MCGKSVMGAKNSDHTSNQTATSSLFFEPLHKAKTSMKKDFGPEGVFQKFYKTILKSCPKESTQAPVCDGGALVPVCNGLGKRKKRKRENKSCPRMGLNILKETVWLILS